MGTNEKEKDKKPRTKYRNILVIVFLLVYIPSFIHWVFGRTTPTGIIQMGNLEDSINTDGWFIRNEVVLKAPFDGICIPSFKEGEKVPAKFSIATVINGSSENLMSELKEKDLKILKAQEENDANLAIFSGDVEKLDKEIKQNLLRIIEDSNRNSMSASYALEDEIDMLIQKRNMIKSGAGNAEAYINSLQQEKQELQEKLKQNTREIISDYSGIVSYAVDGCESLLKPEGIREYTPEFLEGLKPIPADVASGIKPVEAEKPFAKVLTDLDVYIMFILDKNHASLFKTGESVQIRLNEIGKIIDGTVEYISPETGGRSTLAVKTYQAVSETASIRKTNVDLIRKNYEGLKVPLSSLRNINMVNKKAEIVLVKANFAYVREVRIKAVDEEFAILDEAESDVSLYDTYVLRPLNIEEGQYINQ